MRTGPASTTTSTQAPQVKPKQQGTKANGRDHSAASLNGAGPGASRQEDADSIDRAGAAPTTAEDLAKAAEATAKGGAEFRVGDYGTHNECLVGFKRVKTTEVPFYLCNFTARITHELHTETGRCFRIEARLFDRSVRDFTLMAAEFANPRRWVPERLGARASVTVGQYERVTAAIEAISRATGFVDQTTVIATGYTTHHGLPVFIMPNRVIARPGVDTAGVVLHFSDRLLQYSLAEPPDGAAAGGALQAAARLPAIGKLSVMLPLWLQAFRAALPFVPPAAYAVWLHGLTGTLKSSVSAVCLNLFGRGWSYQQMPGTFLDTRTALETTNHLARGLLVVLDDGVGDGSRRGSEAIIAVVSYILREIGNNAARARHRGDMTEQPKRDPRAAVIINAEGLPPGGSAAARAYTVHIKAGDIDKAKLSLAQQDGRNGVLEAAMAVFIQAMLSQDRDQFVTRFETSQQKYRDQAAALQRKGGHGRTANAVGELMATAEVVIEVFEQHGVALPFDLPEALEVLIGGGEAHRATVAHSEPVLMFRRTLRELIESKRVQIAEKSTGIGPNVNAGIWGWPPRAQPGATIGVADIEGLHDAGLGVEEVFLRRDETYAAVIEGLRRAGETPGLDLNSMWGALVDQGFAALNAKTGKSTFAVRVHGVLQRFMKCKISILSDDDDDAAARLRGDGSGDFDDRDEPGNPL